MRGKRSNHDQKIPEESTSKKTRGKRLNNDQKISEKSTLKKIYEEPRRKRPQK